VFARQPRGKRERLLAVTVVLGFVSKLLYPTERQKVHVLFAVEWFKTFELINAIKFLVFLLLPQESPLLHTFFTGEQIFPVAVQNNMAESGFSEHVVSF
jgi:hypothetical protein